MTWNPDAKSPSVVIRQAKKIPKLPQGYYQINFCFDKFSYISQARGDRGGCARRSLRIVSAFLL